VRELARALDMHHTTTHRLLKGLADEGWLKFDPETQRYKVGVELHRIGLKLASRLDIAAVARPYMQQLSRLTRESVYLCLFAEDRLELITVASEESEYPLRYVPELYRYLPLHQGTTGRSILAFLPDEMIQQVIDRGLPASVNSSASDVERLWELLRETRSQGYARSFGERVPESAALGAPIRDANGLVKASLVLVMPKTRWDPLREREWSLAVKDAAGGVSRGLGGIP